MGSATQLTCEPNGRTFQCQIAMTRALSSADAPFFDPAVPRCDASVLYIQPSQLSLRLKTKASMYRRRKKRKTVSAPYYCSFLKTVHRLFSVAGSLTCALFFVLAKFKCSPGRAYLFSTWATRCLPLAVPFAVSSVVSGFWTVQRGDRRQRWTTSTKRGSFSKA